MRIGDKSVPVKGKTVYVSFSAEINPHTTEALIAALGACHNEGASAIYLLLSTPGGHVMNGMTLYNFMRSLPIPVTTHNMGNVDSIGNAVFLGGATRYASPHSTFMFHGVGFNTDAKTRLEEKFLRERLDGLLADQKRIGAILDRTSLSTDKIKSLFGEAQTKDADFAASVGIVDEIREAQIPAGSPILSLVFQR